MKDTPRTVVDPPKCEECGATRGTWHANTCKYRLFSPIADEFICLRIGDKQTHEETFQRWKAMVEEGV